MFTSPGVCAATLVFSIHGVLDPPAHCSLASLLDERRLEVLARHHGIKRTKDAEAIDKLFTNLPADSSKRECSAGTP